MESPDRLSSDLPCAPLPYPTCSGPQLTRCLIAAMTFRRSCDGRLCFRNVSNFVFDIKMFTILRP